MSGIVGIWNIDGRPLDPVVLSSMSASLRHRGSDGAGQRIQGPVGFACQQRWITAEDVGERQPLVGRGGVLLTMDGRLDNREELLPALGLARSVSDATVVLAAYEAWPDGLAERLNGDFALAAFDPWRQRLILVRDSIGIRPLYYFRSDRVLAFASEIKALLTHPDIPARPDDEGIADYMLTCARPLDRQEVTCFAGILALPPAHVAVSTPTRTIARRYWDFDVGRSIRLRSSDEYAEAFRERFAEAVRRRTRSAYPVAVAVSGGLDSSSIFCQAGRLRRSGAANHPALIGISHPGAAGSDADESAYLADVERECGVEIQRFALEPLIGFMQGADEQIRASEAPLVEYMWGRSRELHRRAATAGARMLLTGDWGDQVLFSSTYLVDLFRRFRWQEIRRHTREFFRWVGPAEARVLRRRFVLDLARHDLPRQLVAPVKWVRRRLLGVERPKPWFSRAFLRRGLRFADRPATIGEGFHSAQAGSIYLEARSKYLDFVTLYGDHPKAPYAQFQAGMCSVKQIYSASRDQAQTQIAIDDFKEIDKRWPKSPYARAARQFIGKGQDGLAEHEFIVGSFYLKKKAYQAATERFTGLLEKYPLYGQKDKVYYWLGRTLIDARSPDEGRVWLDQVLNQYPRSKYAKMSKDLLAEAAKKEAAAAAKAAKRKAAS